jgi:hypothetical protein
VPNILRQKLINFCNRCSYSILQVDQDYRHWRDVHLIVNKEPQEKVEGGQIWRSRRPGSGPPFPRPIHRSGNCLFKNVITSLWMCGGALVLS